MLIGVILANLLLCCLFGMVIGLICSSLICELFSDRTTIICSIIAAAISAFLLFGFITPIRMDEAKINATITKMEESATKSTIHRHVYAVTENGEGICIDVNTSEYALFSVNDRIKVDRSTTRTLFNVENTTYKIDTTND